MKTSELIGPTLDWAVLEALGEYKEYVRWREAVGDSVLTNLIWFKRLGGTPSTDWSKGGPIIERELMTIGVYDVAQDLKSGLWSAEMFRGNELRVVAQGYGPTPLIAAMRCYVASKLGDEVEIPEELK